MAFSDMSADVLRMIYQDVWTNGVEAGKKLVLDEEMFDGITTREMMSVVKRRLNAKDIGRCNVCGKVDSFISCDLDYCWSCKKPMCGDCMSGQDLRNCSKCVIMEGCYKCGGYRSNKCECEEMICQRCDIKGCGLCGLVKCKKCYSRDCANGECVHKINF